MQQGSAADLFSANTFYKRLESEPAQVHAFLLNPPAKASRPTFQSSRETSNSRAKRDRAANSRP